MSDAVALALHSASTYQAFIVGQNLATEDLRQARAAFLPRVTAPTILTYNSAERGRPLNAGVPLGPSFISLNAIREYQSTVSLAGDAPGRPAEALGWMFEGSDGESSICSSSVRAESSHPSNPGCKRRFEHYFVLSTTAKRYRGVPGTT